MLTRHSLLTRHSVLSSSLQVLILNKRDLVGTEAERELLEATVSSLNPLAKLSWSEHGSVPLASVLDPTPPLRTPS